MTLRHIRIDGAPVALAYRGRAQAFPTALQQGLRRVMVQVHRESDANLSGGGAAWAYPVPRRSGALARGMYSKLGTGEAEIGNRAPHAWAVHTGDHPFWRMPPALPRPYLDDAVEKTDHLQILHDEMIRGGAL